jgi:organic hydroperoxide reductase OsmC/OhrA
MRGAGILQAQIAAAERLMQPLPHHYVVSASAASSGLLWVTADGVPDLLECAAPAEFDGPGDRWSPEALLCAAIANCFILTFRAVARASGLEWRTLACNVEGILERVDGVTRFTRFVTRATLTVDDADREAALRLLEKAEHGCLIGNSLNARRELRAEVRTSRSETVGA